MSGEAEVAGAGLFWEDLARDLEDPEFLREYIAESVRIATVDSVINLLDDARTAAGLSKAALARAIGAEPATIRRLFTASEVNPTLGTVAQVAAALGLRVTVEPLPESDREVLTTPLHTGRTSEAAIQRLLEIRGTGRAAVAT